MSDNIISVQGLGKSYRLSASHGVSRYRTLIDEMSSVPQQVLSRLQGRSPSSEVFWALKDVSFDVKRGEVVGIIGRNGAGKSTLLKLLSRITPPTEGRAEINGRIGSLLEVGTGFHPELTGRENIFLNGAVLGMSRAEIQKKFDEIVAFAEVEKFLDTPVKHFSSGMYVRLAFAVAAHLEPEILLVDEVLAVGDAQFQKKCLGKMGESTKQGRTILFVSHNMQAIRQLCSKVIVLDKGRIIERGSPEAGINLYLQNYSLPYSESVESLVQKIPADPNFRLTGVKISQFGQPVRQQISNGDVLDIEIAYQVLQPTTGLRVYFDVCDKDGTLLFRSFHDDQADGIPAMPAGAYVSTATIPANLLAPVCYDIVVNAGIFNVRNCLHGFDVRIPIEVVHTGLYNKAYLSDTFRGKLAPLISWNTVLRSQ